jgi:hypothetical protein
MKRLSILSLALLSPVWIGLAQPVEVALGVRQLGTFQNPSITESSGVVSSRVGRGIYWTHNDGGAPVLYSFTTNGAAQGEWTIQNLEIRDWEDIASGGGRLYIADIGNNHGDPGEIYAVSEPNPRRSGNLRVLKRLKLEYPGSPFDAESFFISHSFGYIIEKESGNAHVYRFRLSGRTAGRLVEQCNLNTEAPVTGAAATKDSRRLAVITDVGAYLFSLPRRVPTEGTLEPTLFVPYALDGMESCTFTRSGLLVTAETGQILLFTDPLFHIR